MGPVIAIVLCCALIPIALAAAAMLGSARKNAKTGSFKEAILRLLRGRRPDMRHRS